MSRKLTLNMDSVLKIGAIALAAVFFAGPKVAESMTPPWVVNPEKLPKTTTTTTAATP